MLDHTVADTVVKSEVSEPRAEMATEKTKPRRLRGHKDTATCCIGSSARPDIVVTSGEDGRLCWFDLRCREAQLVMDVSEEPISSICFRPGKEDIIYVSSGKEVKCFDVNLGDSWKPLESYNFNKEDINQIVCNSKSSFLAAADDSGDVKIIDVRQQCLYKTLRSGHTSICSSVQFLPWRSWEDRGGMHCLVDSRLLMKVNRKHSGIVYHFDRPGWFSLAIGGLDSKLLMWDFSKGRSYEVMDFGLPDVTSSSNLGQCLNPAFVHAVAVPEVDMLDKLDKVCAVARGDGAVSVIRIESDLTAPKSKGSLKPRKGSQSKWKDASSSTTNMDTDQNGKMLHLDSSMGGHSAAVSCVAFSLFGEKGKYILSGGNDCSVKLWNCSSYFHAGTSSSSNSNNDFLYMNITLPQKVNWLCTRPAETNNLVVCDTSKVVKVYSVR